MNPRGSVITRVGREVATPPIWGLSSDRNVSSTVNFGYQSNRKWAEVASRSTARMFHVSNLPIKVRMLGDQT